MAAEVTMAARDTPWYTEVEPLPEGVAPAIVPYEEISVIANLKPYSLRNGTPEEIEPYLLTSAIPTVYHWVPINGLAPRDAMKCVDGFIRCYLYRMAQHAPAGMTPEARRKAAIILGVCRAVITVNFELINTDINAQESAGPLLAVDVVEGAAPIYTALVGGNSEHVALLRNNVDLTDVELEVVKTMARCAQAIIPVQGLNLITDGHHYLSDKSKQSYKAFLAIERQVWMPRAFKEWMAGVEDFVRDVTWHKAGHPVSAVLKENAATNPQVKENLEAAKLGSAAARLPALESDLRAADTYLKLAEAVDAIWGTMGGSVDSEVLRFRVAVVKAMARSAVDFDTDVDMGEQVGVKNRTAALNVLKATVAKNTDKAAVLYGFYCSMLDMGAGDMMGASTDTLRSAFSLKKLRSNNIASYLIGVEMYKDYRVMRNAARKASDKRMPEYTLDW